MSKFDVRWSKLFSFILTLTCCCSLAKAGDIIVQVPGLPPAIYAPGQPITLNYGTFTATQFVHIYDADTVGAIGAPSGAGPGPITINGTVPDGQSPVLFVLIADADEFFPNFFSTQVEYGVTNLAGVIVSSPSLRVQTRLVAGIAGNSNGAINVGQVFRFDALGSINARVEATAFSDFGLEGANRHTIAFLQAGVAINADIVAGANPYDQVSAVGRIGQIRVINPDGVNPSSGIAPGVKIHAVRSIHSVISSGPIGSASDPVEIACQYGVAVLRAGPNDGTPAYAADFFAVVDTQANTLNAVDNVDNPGVGALRIETAGKFTGSVNTLTITRILADEGIAADITAWTIGYVRAGNVHTGQVGNLTGSIYADRFDSPDAGTIDPGGRGVEVNGFVDAPITVRFNAFLADFLATSFRQTVTVGRQLKGAVVAEVRERDPVTNAPVADPNDPLQGTIYGVNIGFEDSADGLRPERPLSAPRLPSACAVS